ncbi:hypothetical protein CH263_24135 [Rhodococcus sp. 06-1059B-a]|nr:PQQ-binding-like beta-propeller repeat protein [Rhodococcus sp. 06-1059B-a]OZD58357.1 hypothetical protein CH263_24135 [Rhodococcus sp. 06-1059B-a]
MADRSAWTLAAAAVFAAVTVTAAGVVLFQHTPPTAKKITGTDDGTPGLAWSFDVATALDRPWAELVDPRAGVVFPNNAPSAIEVGDTLVSAAGVNRDGYSLEDPVMIGIDANTGELRWQTPAAAVSQCSDTPLDGKIVCYAAAEKYEIVTFDAESGDVERRPVDESVFAVAVADDTLYVVEGDAENYDVRVHAGTVDDLSATWVRQFEAGGGWEEIFSGAALSVRDGIGLVGTVWQSATFDARTGEELTGVEPDLCITSSRLVTGGVVVQNQVECTTYDSVTEVLRAPEGQDLARVDSGAVHNPYVDSPTDATVPVVLGDSGFDRETGEKLWTYPPLIQDVGGQAVSALVAVIGDIGLLRDPATSSTSAIDLRTGEELWRRDEPSSLNPSGFSDSIAVGEDGEALLALDMRTGETLWRAPFDAIVDTDVDTSWWGTAIPRGEDWIYVSAGTVLGLTPL